MHITADHTLHLAIVPRLALAIAALLAAMLALSGVPHAAPLTPPAVTITQ